MHKTMPPLLIQQLDNFPSTNQTPAYMSAEAAGMDIQSAEALTLKPGQSAAVRTGLAFAVPAGFEMQVRSRSGLAAKHAVFVTNGIGTIDSDYRGEVMVLLSNFGKKALEIAVGDRVAQLVFAEVIRPVVVQLAGALPPTDRGTGGLGSTGFGQA